MPAKSKAQQKAAGAALSAKRGDTKKSELKGASKSMYESWTKKNWTRWLPPNARESRSTHPRTSPLFPARPRKTHDAVAFAGLFYTVSAPLQRVPGAAGT